MIQKHFYSLDDEREVHEGKRANALQRVCTLVGLACECGGLYQVAQWVGVGLWKEGES